MLTILSITYIIIHLFWLWYILYTNKYSHIVIRYKKFGNFFDKVGNNDGPLQIFCYHLFRKTFITPFVATGARGRKEDNIDDEGN